MARSGLQTAFNRRAEAQRRAWKLHTWTTLPLLLVMWLVIAIVVIPKAVESLLGLLR